MTEKLTDAQQRVLNVLTRKVISGDAWSVHGIDMRKAVPDAENDVERQRVVDSLCPKCAQRSSGEPPNDRYELTLEGLLASNEAGPADIWIQGLLAFLKRKYEREGAFNTYSWQEVLDDVGFDGWRPTEDRLPLARTVIHVAGLSNGPQAVAPPETFTWGRPLDIERLVKIRGSSELVELLKQQAREAAEQKEALLDPNVIARQVFDVFAMVYRREGRSNWAFSPDDDAIGASTGLSVAARRGAFDLMRAVGLVKLMGAGRRATLEQAGIRAVANAALLDDVLPVPGGNVRPTAAPTFDANFVDLTSRLGFVGEHNPDLRDLITRDLRELEGALHAQLWKASLMLCGSILEAILLDVLERRRDLAAPYLKKRKFPEDASLDDLLVIAADADLVGDGKVLISSTAKQAGIAVKDHRDLIHPHRQLRESMVIDRDTANAMVNLLRLVARDLSRAADAGVIVAYENK